MKKLSIKVYVLSMAFIGFALTSCTNDSGSENTDSQIDLKTAESETEIDNVNEETSAIIEDAFLAEETVAAKSNATYRYLPDCVTVTATIEQNYKYVTIDFGDGCELRNGHSIKGKLHLEYEFDLSSLTHMITYTYDDFYFNESLVEGGGSIFREWSNSNGNPQSSKTFAVKVTWPSGANASKEGTRVREWIEGFDTLAWGDNIFLVTGSWTFTKVDGTIINAEIKTALRRELSCKFFVSGTVELSKSDNTALVDYGNGSCDDLATVSLNGNDPVEINLSDLRN